MSKDRDVIDCRSLTARDAVKAWQEARGKREKRADEQPEAWIRAVLAGSLLRGWNCVRGLVFCGGCLVRGPARVQEVDDAF